MRLSLPPRGQSPAWTQKACECGHWHLQPPLRPAPARGSLCSLRTAHCPLLDARGSTRNSSPLPEEPEGSRRFHSAGSQGPGEPGLGRQVHVWVAERWGENQASQPLGTLLSQASSHLSPTPSTTSSPSHLHCFPPRVSPGPFRCPEHQGLTASHLLPASLTPGRPQHPGPGPHEVPELLRAEARLMPLGNPACLGQECAP